MEVAVFDAVFVNSLHIGLAVGLLPAHEVSEMDDELALPIGLLKGVEFVNQFPDFIDHLLTFIGSELPGGCGPAISARQYELHFFVGLNGVATHSGVGVQEGMNEPDLP